MRVAFDAWNNDLTMVQAKFKRNAEAEIIKIEFDTEDVLFTKRLSLDEAEELMKELSDHIRWIKEA